MTRRVFNSVIATTLFLCAIAAFAGEQPAPTRVACIGDSITFGYGTGDRARNSYPAQLGTMLGRGNFGVNAATLLKKGNKPYWNLGQFKAAQAYQPSIVIIKLGTNDTKPRNWKHKQDFASNYVEMVRTFQGLASKPAVWICYPVPVFPEQWGINDKTVKGEIIPLIDKVAKETGAKIIDLYKVLAGKPELVPDKVHPNAASAKLMAEAVAAVVTGKILQEAH